MEQSHLQLWEKPIIKNAGNSVVTVDHQRWSSAFRSGSSPRDFNAVAEIPALGIFNRDLIDIAPF